MTSRRSGGPARYLEAEGFRVSEAATGAAALAQVREQSAPWRCWTGASNPVTETSGAAACRGGDGQGHVIAAGCVT
jgi:hypothetical protein